MPQYRSKYWDGKIRLFSTATGEIYVGLLDKICAWAKKSNYTVSFKDNKFYGTPFEKNDNISREGVKDYITSISRHKPRDYQVEGVYDALRYNRRLLISPTIFWKVSDDLFHRQIFYGTEKTNSSSGSYNFTG